MVNRGSTRAYCSLTQHVKPRWWPLRAFSWPAVVVLDLSYSRGPGGLKLISRQEVLIGPGALLRPLPLLGAAYEVLARRAAALGICAGVWAAGRLYRGALAAYEALVVAVGGDAGPPPELENGPRKPAPTPHVRQKPSPRAAAASLPPGYAHA